MRVLVTILILAAFLQTTFLPINLVLMILVLRAYIRVDKQNLFLAFGFGLLISLLEQQPLGAQSIVYLGLIQLTHLLSKTPFSKNILGVIPLVLLALSLDYLIISVISRESIEFLPGKIFFESFLSLPIYIVLKLWEERFIVHSDIKLKI